METNTLLESPEGIAILSHVGDEALTRLSFSDGFGSFYGGDADRIRWMLRGIACGDQGGVAVAVAPEGVVGFLGILAPLPGDRFYTIPAAVELKAGEVVPAFRQRGIFRALFHAALGDAVESRIVFAVADPAHREARESIRAFRRRVQAAFGALGFFPYPTDHPGVRHHRDTVFLARIGRGVARTEAAEFLERLRLPDDRPARVAVFLRGTDMRNLVRTDLERHDFEVVAVGATPAGAAGADAVVTEFGEPSGAPVTVRVVDDDISHDRNGVLYLPQAQLDTLPEVLRAEMTRRRSTPWPRFSKSGS